MIEIPFNDFRKENEEFSESQILQGKIFNQIKMLTIFK